ncbi:MAG: hypothetical protein ACP5O1_08510 [Phycisphaerae bacterium]
MRRWGKVTRCSANIREVVQALFAYASINGGRFPTVAPPYHGRYENSPGHPLRGETYAMKVVYAFYLHLPAPSARRKKKGTPLIFPGIRSSLALHQGSPLACMWILVLQDYATPRSFICPADPFGTRPSTQFVKPTRFRCASNFGLLFEGHHKAPKLGHPGQGESYSIAFPWQGNKTAVWWTDNITSGVPVMSDMAPAKDIHEHGKNRKAYRNPAAPLFPGKRYWEFNSGNHGGQGQNVGYGDDHVTWNTNPYAGQHGDNIFTWGSPHRKRLLGGGRVLGTGRRVKCPTNLPNTQPYDTVMVLGRNVATGAW